MQSKKASKASELSQPGNGPNPWAACLQTENRDSAKCTGVKTELYKSVAELVPKIDALERATTAVEAANEHGPPTIKKLRVQYASVLTDIKSLSEILRRVERGQPKCPFTKLFESEKCGKCYQLTGYIEGLGNRKDMVLKRINALDARR